MEDEFDEFGILIKKADTDVQVDEFGIPIKQPDTPKGVNAKVDGGLDSTLVKEDSLSGLKEIKASDPWGNSQTKVTDEDTKGVIDYIDTAKSTKDKEREDGKSFIDTLSRFPKLVEEKRKLKEELKLDLLNEDNPDKVKRLEEIEKTLKSPRKSFRRVSKEKLQDVTSKINALDIKDNELGANGSYISGSTEYKRLNNVRKGLEIDIKDQTARLDKIKKDNSLGKEFVRFIFPLKNLLPTTDTETVELNEKVEEEILLKLESNPKLRSQVEYGGDRKMFLNLEERESLIKNAKVSAFEKENKIIEEGQAVLSKKYDETEDPLERAELEDQFQKLNNKKLGLFGVYNIDKATGEIDNIFKRTTEKEDYKESLSENGILDNVSTLVGGFGTVVGNYLTSGAGLVAGLGDIFTDNKKYSIFDALGDTAYELSNRQLLPNSNQEDSRLFNEEGEFTPSIYSIGKTATTMAPFTIGLIAGLRKGDGKGTYTKIGKFLSPKNFKETTMKVNMAKRAYQITLNDNLKEAKDLGLNGGKAFVYQQISSLATAMVSTINPDFKFFNTAAGKGVIQNFVGDLKSAVNRKALNATIIGFFKNLGKEVGEEEVEAFIKDMTSLGLAKNYQSTFLKEDFQKNLVANTLFGTLPFAGLGLKSNYNTTKKQYYVNLKENFEATDLELDEIVKTSKDKKMVAAAKEAKQNIRDISYAIDNSPEDVTGTQIDLLVKKQKVVDEMKDVDNAFHEPYKKKIEDINEEITKDMQKVAEENLNKVKRKKSIISADNSSNYANLTEDGDGNFVFYHVGKEGYETIQPSTGKNSITSREEAAAMSKVGGVAMFYTNKETQEQRVEGDSKYEVKVAKDKVYDFNSDPLNLIDQAEALHKEEHPDKAFDKNTQVAYVAKVAGAKGFDMVVAEWNGTTRAQTTKALTPTDVQTTSGSTVTKKFKGDYTSNKKKGFDSVIPETKQGALKKFYDKVNNIKSKAQVYDKVYNLKEDSSKKSQGDITKLIEDSDLSKELKTEYLDILSKEYEGRSSRVVEKTATVSVENAPKGTFLNIGTFVGKTKEKINLAFVKSKLPKGVEVLNFALVKGTEPAFSVELSRPLTEVEMKNFLKDTEQFAIPQMTEGEGTMYGTKDWGDFDPKEFIMLDNTPVSEQVKKVTDLERVKKLNSSVDKARKALSKIFPDVVIEVYQDEEGYAVAANEVNDKERTNGEWDGKNTIRINASKANGRTVMHEVFHAVLSKKVGNNPDIKKISDKFAKALEGRLDSKVTAELNDFANKYSEGVKTEEAVAELAGMLADNYTSLDKSVKEIIKGWINDIAKVLGIDMTSLENDSDIVNLLETLSKKVAKGKVIKNKDVSILNDIEGGKQVENPAKALDRKQVGGFDVSYTEQNNITELKKKGLIKEPNNLEFLSNKQSAITSPDDMLAGKISIDGKEIFEGGGGVFFVTKYGDVWASGKKGTAETLARTINNSIKENGDNGYLSLTKGSDSKLISSASGVNSSLAILGTILDKGLVSKSDFRRAVVTSVKKNGGDINLKLESKNLNKEVDKFFSNPNTTTFDKRGFVVRDIISNLVQSKSVKENSSEIVSLLGGDINKKLGVGNTPLSQSMVDLVAGVASEKLTKGLSVGDVYAVIEVDGEVVVKQDNHPSYPWHIVTKSGNKPILHLPKNRGKGADLLTLKSGKRYKVGNVSVMSGSFNGVRKQVTGKTGKQETTKSIGYKTSTGKYKSIVKTFNSEDHFSNWVKVMSNKYGNKIVSINTLDESTDKRKQKSNKDTSKVIDRLNSPALNKAIKRAVSATSNKGTTLFEKSWDSSLNSVVKSIEDGGSLVEALEEGLVQLRKTKWYKESLSPKGQRMAERKYNDFFREEFRNVLDDNTLENRVKNFITKGKQKFVEQYTNINEAIKHLDGWRDFYKRQGLFESKAADLVDDMLSKIKEAVKTIGKSNFTTKEVSDYMYAKHAIERNKHVIENIDEENPYGSGMTDAEANRILESFSKEEIVEIEELATPFYELIEDSRNNLVKNDLMSQKDVDNLINSNNFYVPLTGFADEQIDLGQHVQSSKVTVKGREFHKLKGRTTEAGNIISNIVKQYTDTAIRGSKNELLLEFQNIANKNKDVPYKIYTKESLPEGKGLNAKGKVNYTKKPAQMDESFIGFKDNGVQKYIQFDNPVLAKNLNKATDATVDGISRNLGALNRYLSAVFTQYNPTFMASNFLRDSQTGIINLKAQADINPDLKGEDISGRVSLNIRRAIATIQRVERGIDTATEYSKYYQEFKKAGAKTGWANRMTLKDITAKVESLENLFSTDKSINKEKIIQGFKSFTDVVQLANTSIENGIRLATYVEARKIGLSEVDAASLAKELTINFNRKGELSSLMNTLFMFFNAGVQGSANLAKNMFVLKEYTDSKGVKRKGLNRGQKVALAIQGASFALALLNMGLSDDDEAGLNYYNQIPDYIKERNLIIMHPWNGGETYSTIPMPYGYNVISNMGTLLAETTFGDRNIKSASGFLLGSMVGSFSPMNVPEGEVDIDKILLTVTPTALKPFAELSRNKSNFGNRIFKENFIFSNEKLSQAHLGGKNTASAYKSGAILLNSISGGNEYDDGVLSFHPDKAEYLVDFFGGGALKFLKDTWGVGENLYLKATGTDIELPARKIPFLNKVYGEDNRFPETAIYYDVKKNFEGNYNHLRNKKPSEMSADEKGELKQLTRLSNLYKYTDKKMRAIRKREKEIILMKDSREKLLKLESIEQEKVNRFSKHVKEYLNLKKKLKNNYEE